MTLLGHILYLLLVSFCIAAALYVVGYVVYATYFLLRDMFWRDYR